MGLAPREARRVYAKLGGVLLNGLLEMLRPATNNESLASCAGDKVASKVRENIICAA